MQKYGFTDARDVLERASARETAARVAAGAAAKALLRHIGVEVVSHVVQLGAARARPGVRPGPGDLDAVDGSPVRCFDAQAEAAMVAEVKAAAKDGDSLGGVVEVLAHGVPVGLGSHVHWDRKLDARLARGRVPLVLEILAPNQRPVQVTDDLASFWRTTYAAVRRELRGRYPKHDWPEDPAAGRPSARGTAGRRSTR